MGDKIKGFTIVLKDDVSGEVAEKYFQIFSMLCGVLRVTSVIVGSEDYFSRERIKAEFTNKIYEILS